MPAFVTSVKDSLPGYGSASCYGVVNTAAFAAGPVTITIPATGATTPSGGTAFNLNGGPAPSRGRGRIRTSSVGGAATLTAVLVAVTDGSTTLNVFGAPAITVAGTVIDWTFEFNTDLGITSVTLTGTLAGAGATFDFELAMV